MSALSTSGANATCLEREIDWFNQVLDRRISLYFEQQGEDGDIYHLQPPDLANDDSDMPVLPCN